MKTTMKLGFLALMAVALVFIIGSSAMAFHEAAKLKCMACHTMHASENGSAGNVTPSNGFNAAPTDGMSGPNAQLLVQSNKTDLCLACHASNYTINSEYAPDVGGASTATPGGDFYLAGAGNTSNGHNPYYASGGAIPKDAVFTTDTPPGGSAALWEWSCLSCHTT